MKKLKIILLFSFIIISIRCYYIVNNLIIDSKYNYDTKEIKGTIKSYQIDGNYLKLEVKAKEKIIVQYYFKTEEEMKKVENKIKIGSYIYSIGKFEKPSVNTNFYLFNYQKYLLSKKIYWIMKADKINFETNSSIFYKIKNKIIERIKKSENSTYLKLFILGENTLEDKINSNYQKLGISHLFAISGMHITLLTSIILFILKKKFNNKYFHFIFLFIFLHFYMFLTDFSPSIIRATYLFIGINIKKIFSIQISNKLILKIIFFVMLLINPYYIYNIGFVFSFSISFGLLCASNEIKKYKHYFSKLFITSLISFLISIPILISNFHQIHILSPIFNMIFVPIVTTIIFPLSLITFFITLLDCILSQLLIVLEIISNFCSSINFGVIILPSAPFLFYMIYYIPLIFIINKISLTRILLFVILLIVHSNIRLFQNYPIITMIDVGQGDSILIELSHNQGNILIDTGGTISYQTNKWKQRKNKYSISDNVAIPYLKAIGIHKIDLLILTHGDYDHMGEAINLVNNFKVEKVIFNCGEFNDLEQNLIKVLNKKKISYYSCIKELNINNNKLYFLNNKDYGNENDNSSVIYTELNGYKFMFMGDAGVEVEDDLIDKYNLKDIDVLKVGHHGSKTSSGKEFIDEIKPKYSIISVGKNNRYGHPNKEVLDNLNKSNVYRTDENGSIMFRIKNNKLKIETCSQ